MSWEDSDALISRLNRSLDAFNWKEAEEICKQIIGRIKTDSKLLPESLAKKLLGSLRRKRQFSLVTQLSEAVLQSGLSTPLIRRQYAQALIDSGEFPHAESLLQENLLDPNSSKGELGEAHGLIGRIYKQIYVNNNDPGSAQNSLNLKRALTEYLETFRLGPKENTWHGINAVALLLRAQRDNQPLSGWPDPLVLAQEILATLEEREQEIKNLPAWDLATRMEAYVALDRYEEAAATALKYIACKDADAFELSSTIRQFTEVWQLNDQEPPGNHLLPILKAGHLSKEGAAAASDLKNLAEEAAATVEATNDCGLMVGESEATPLKWYKEALDRCRSIARIETLAGKGLGTGWLVNASDFFPDETGVLLLTNEHVINNGRGTQLGARPDEAQANFQSLGKILKIKDIVWSNSHEDLDATFLTLEGEPDTAPLRLEVNEIYGPSTRLYIISEGSGAGDPKMVLQDSYLLAQNESILHYRTPEEGISSGSPVFEPGDWRVVALHHASAEVLPRIDGREGTYEASEGISIAAIQRATQAHIAERGRASAGRGFMPTAAGAEGDSVADEQTATADVSQASFRITLEGEAARDTTVVFGTNVDLVFDYAPPPEAESTGTTVERSRMLQVPLGIMVVPVGFKFTAEGEAGYRQVRFYQSKSNEKERFKLRATREPEQTQSDSNPHPAEPGFHIIFDLRGSVLRQLFLPVRLVKERSEFKEDAEAEKLCTFDLDYLKQFDEQTVRAQERVAVALQKVLA